MSGLEQVKGCSPVPNIAITCTLGIAPSFGSQDRRRDGLASSHRIWAGRELDRAAANASRGQVKNLAEKPLFCSMAARVDALMSSSSTTKMRES
jgi:hypothetical protein